MLHKMCFLWPRTQRLEGGEEGEGGGVLRHPVIINALREVDSIDLFMPSYARLAAANQASGTQKMLQSVSDRCLGSSRYLKHAGAACL